MHATCPVPPAPTLTPFFLLEGKHHALAWPLREGAPACAPETPCPRCGEHDAAAYERPANLVLSFPPAHVGHDARVCCVHCAAEWPIQLEPDDAA